MAKRTRRRSKPMSVQEILEQAARRRLERLKADINLEWGISPETLKIAEARGDEITSFPARPGEREKPPKRLSGLDWLWFKNRIDATQMGAGLKYGDDYRTSHDLRIRSGSNLDPGGGDGTMSIDARIEAQIRLSKAQHLGLNDHPDLISLCDAIAGEGARIRDLAKGDDATSLKMEARFVIALDHLARFYGMVFA